MNSATGSPCSFTSQPPIVSLTSPRLSGLQSLGPQQNKPLAGSCRFSSAIHCSGPWACARPQSKQTKSSASAVRPVMASFSPGVTARINRPNLRLNRVHRQRRHHARSRAAAVQHAVHDESQASASRRHSPLSALRFLIYRFSQCGDGTNCPLTRSALHSPISDRFHICRPSWPRQFAATA